MQPSLHMLTLAQEDSGGSGVGGMIFMLLCLAAVVVMIVGLWKMFEKAGQPGWGAIIPILNIYFLVKIAERPAWWTLLMFIPFVSILVALVVYYDIAKRFGGGIGTVLGILFLPFIFFPLLGLGDARYTSMSHD